jgi:hypothetical protein
VEQLWLATPLSECPLKREATNTILKTRGEVSLKSQLSTCLTNLEEGVENIVNARLKPLPYSLNIIIIHSYYLNSATTVHLIFSF